MSTAAESDDGAAAIAPPREGALRAFRHRDYAIFWTGALVSNTGSWLQNLTVPYVIFEITHSALWVGAATAAQFFPGFFGSPVGGHLADTRERHRLLVVFLSVLSVLALALWWVYAAGVHSVGVILGLVAAFSHWVVDFVIMRVMDLIMAVPGLVLAILIVAILGPSLTNTIVAVTIVFLPRYVRLVRASAIAELSKEYVTAAKVSGVRLLRLMFVTVLPNCLAPLTVQAALGVSEAILEAAALGFLGLGAQPPAPEWGAMLADNREFIRSNPWVMAWPGFAILATVVSINLVGDGLRDALDPKLQRS